MILPAHDADAAKRIGQHAPDVVVLDLEYSVPPRLKGAAREGLKSLVASFGPAAPDIFVRIDRETRWADAGAAVQRGVSGVVFPGPESPDEVAELGALIAAKERERGVEPDTTEIVLMLESAKGFWDAANIAAASARVTAMGVGRIDLTMALGPVPQDEFRFYRFLMTRALVAARMHAKQPLGALWRPGSRGGVAPQEATVRAAHDGRMMGFSGCFCVSPEQVPAVNSAYGANA